LGDQFEQGETSGACGTLEEKRNAFRILVGKPEGKRPLVKDSSFSKFENPTSKIYIHKEY
jgi:hypothetical protein